MNIKISFYLLTPKAKTQSNVYVSLSRNYERIRFASGECFVTSNCNTRKTKGKKSLVKSTSTNGIEYNDSLNSISLSLERIARELSKENNNFPLTRIRDQYYKEIGKLEDKTKQTLEEAFQDFLKKYRAGWGDNTEKKFTGLFNHLKEFEDTFRIKLSFDMIDEELWFKFRDKYLVAKKKFSNPTSNKYLSCFKQFLRFAVKKGFMSKATDFEDYNYLEEIEPFKIALKEPEYETMVKIDLSDNPRLDKVRDLFVLEMLTGQRYSDIPKILDRNNISDTSIRFYQQKTKEQVHIPLHPRLKKRIDNLFDKYPSGFPSISNQKFNEYLKEICQLCEFNKEHSWITLSGKNRREHTDFRYNLITSHTGRRTFCTLALKRGIEAELIMKVTGHRKYEQFREYVKVDDDDLEEVFGKKF